MKKTPVSFLHLISFLILAWPAIAPAEESASPDFLRDRFIQLNESKDYHDAVSLYYQHRDRIDSWIQAAQTGVDHDEDELFDLELLAHQITTTFRGIGDYAQAISYQKIVEKLQLVKWEKSNHRMPENKRMPPWLTRSPSLMALLRLYQEAGNLSEIMATVEQLLKATDPSAMSQPFAGDDETAARTEAFGVSFDGMPWMYRHLAFNHLANLHKQLGDYESALLAQRQAFETMEKAMAAGFTLFGDIAKSQGLISLAELEAVTGNLADANRHVDALLSAASGGPKKRMGDPLADFLHSDEVTSLRNNPRPEDGGGNSTNHRMASVFKFQRQDQLANLLLLLGRQDEAKTWLEEARTSLDAIGSEGGRDSAMKRQKVSRMAAKLEMALGNPAAAAAHWEECLVQSTTHHTTLDLASDTLEVHQGLAWCLLGTDPAKAAAHARQAHALLLQTLNNVFTFATERQRLAFFQSTDAFSLFANLSMTPELAGAVIQMKGVVLESLIEERRLYTQGQQSGKAPVLSRLLAARKRLLELNSSGVASSTGQEETSQLREELRQFESQISRGAGMARRSLAVTLGDIRQALPPDSVLVEFIRYRRPDASSGFQWQEHYGALLIDQDAEPHFVDLGEAPALEALINDFSAQLRKEWTNDIATQRLQELYQRIIQPIAPAIAGKQRLVLSPEGPFHFVPFAALINANGQLLVESFDLRQVTSARDLLGQRPPPPEPSLLVVADPEYDLAPGQTGTPAGSDRMGALDVETLARHGLQRLEGTGREMQALSTLALQRGWKVHSFDRSRATETALRQHLNAHSPAILHLATHGIQLSRKGSHTHLSRSLDGPRFLFSSLTSSQENAAQPARWLPAFPLSADDPMSASLLALSGAVPTFRQWQQGIFPASDTDGVLTADELVEFDLAATQLVVLSACQTGVGATLSGQGLWGFKRSLALAGARNVLVTLWPVPDDATSVFMTKFYQRIDLQHAPARPFAEVQKEMLLSYRDKQAGNQGLAYAVYCFAPFVMASNGGPLE